MARGQKEETHPEFFECPFVATNVRQYTFTLPLTLTLTPNPHSNPNPHSHPHPNPDQVKQYTFREVRQKFGDQFKQRFWPVFQVRSK